MEEKNKTIEQLKNRLDNKNKIHVDGVPRMDRVPSRTCRWFMDYAQDYFCSDYGLCFKHIIDTFRGMTPVGYDELQMQINEQSEEINNIKILLNNKHEENKTVIKMANGKEIPR